jgi:urease accessory protein
MSTGGLARALQFGDSMFPVGGFAFSSGLESAVQEGVVTDVATLGGYVRTALAQAARGDGIGLVCAHRAASAADVDTLVAIDRRIHARKLSSETRTMSTRMGKKFAEMAATTVAAPLVLAWKDRIDEGGTPGCYPVSVAVAFAAQGLSAHEAFVVHQYGVAATILSAALRLMKVSHVHTQTLLFGLLAGVDAEYERAQAAALDDMAGFAPLTEILAAVHVKAHVRLFMN